MHSIPKDLVIEAKDILVHVLSTNHFLHGDQSWPKRRLAYSETEEFWAAYPQTANYTYGFVLDEMAIAVQNLPPSIIKTYLGFDKRARSYICPNCYGYADRKLQREVMPHLAQLRPRSAASKSLYCFVCEKTFAVLRQRCQADQCRSNVLSDETDPDEPAHRGMCLVCQEDNQIQ
jgi:hypothetical protein